MSEERLILVGRVAGAFGVKGEVRITAYTEDPLSLLDYGPLLREDGSPGLTLGAGRAAKNDFIGRVEGVSTREDAEALRGLKLYVHREALPPPEEDEFYLSDLLGLAVVSPQGEPMGRIKSVQDFGAGDLLEIQPPAGATWYLAFTMETVPEVDIPGGKVVAIRPVEIEDEPGT